MKNFICLLLLILVLPVQKVFPQYGSYLGYYFLQSTFYPFTEITDGTISTATGDDGAENINLPFPFTYMGITYTTARISVNGWLEMGQVYTGTGHNNQLESTTSKPFLCPLWDDLSDDSQSEISYKLTGAYPARFFTIQWKNLKWLSSTNYNRKTFQIRLWEIDGTIDFIYGPGTMVSSNSSFSIGLNNHIGGPGNFISITPNLVYLPDISITEPNNNNFDLSLIHEGLMYSFVTTPPADGSALVYQAADTLLPGTVNQKILSVIITTHCGDILTSPWVTGFDFNTYGTSDPADIINAKLFYSGSSSDFSTATQIGTTYPNPVGEFMISGNRYQINNNVTYFWLVYDISPDADFGNIIDGNCTKIYRDNCCPFIIPDTSLTTPGIFIVPVELTGFTGFQNDKSVELKWITKTELNNSGFEVHRRSLKGKWESLGFVKGAGSSSEPQNYVYIDKNVTEGIYYYRLKQVDLDGSFNYSESIEVTVTGIYKYSLEQNFPNPFNPATKIKFNIAHSGLVILKVYDIFGAEVVSLLNEIRMRGEHEVLFDASELPSGVYFYKLSTAFFIQTKKMLLIR